MNILIAGASGLIGQALIHGLAREHQITALGRDQALLEKTLPHDVACITWDSLDDLDANDFQAVINLCGHNVAAWRWTAKTKEAIISSRVDTTQVLINWIMMHNATVHFYCANAIGIYGLQENGSQTDLTEDTPIDRKNPKDFLSEVGIRWQDALKEAEKAGLPVTSTRFGVVLKAGKGFLGKLYPSFYCGLGSVIGNGSQYLSWVDCEDLVNAYRFLLDNPSITGPVNITAPTPCTQKEFATAYAHALHRPLVLRTPAWFIKLLFGEMGDCLMNHGQRVIPQRLLAAGFTFKYTTIEEALLEEEAHHD